MFDTVQSSRQQPKRPGRTLISPFNISGFEACCSGVFQISQFIYHSAQKWAGSPTPRRLIMFPPPCLPRRPPHAASPPLISPQLTSHEDGRYYLTRAAWTRVLWGEKAPVTEGERLDMRRQFTSLIKAGPDERNKQVSAVVQWRQVLGAGAKCTESDSNLGE